MEIQIPNKWKPRRYQKRLWSYMENGGTRAVCIWPRRHGKDSTAINWCARSMVKRPGLYWHCFPTYNQGRKIAWDGFTRDGRPFLDAFPSPLIESKNNNEMRIQLKNSSIYQVVGTDNPDRLVGANPFGVMFSEFSISDPQAWNLIRPILKENGGWAVFIYTPRGRNHGHKLYEMAKQKEAWFAERLTAETALFEDERTGEVRRVFSDADIEEERETGMPEEMIQQEYYCSFDAPLVGAYYAEAMTRAMADERIGEVPYDPAKMVYTAWDLGVGDSTAIWFYQIHGDVVHVIDYYEDSGKGLSHYVGVIKDCYDVYDRHTGPHDLKQREFGSGKSRLQLAREMGIRFHVLPKVSVDEGIDAVRRILPKCKFDAKKCERGIEALRQYRKEWDDKHKVYRDTPLHDWTSHAADAFRYLALGYRDKPTAQRKPPQERAISEYNMFALT